MTTGLLAGLATCIAPLALGLLFFLLLNHLRRPFNSDKDKTT